jgi:hypothetical protein
MIIIVSENPEPNDPSRKDSNMEVRLMIKGATDIEGESLGDAIRTAVAKLRPRQKLRAFEIDEETVLASKI